MGLFDWFLGRNKAFEDSSPEEEISSILSPKNGIERRPCYDFFPIEDDEGEPIGLCVLFRNVGPRDRENELCKLGKSIPNPKIAQYLESRDFYEAQNFPEIETRIEEQLSQDSRYQTLSDASSTSNASVIFVMFGSLPYSEEEKGILEARREEFRKRCREDFIELAYGCPNLDCSNRSHVRASIPEDICSSWKYLQDTEIRPSYYFTCDKCNERFRFPPDSKQEKVVYWTMGEPQAIWGRPNYEQEGRVQWCAKCNTNLSLYIRTILAGTDKAVLDVTKDALVTPFRAECRVCGWKPLDYSRVEEGEEGGSDTVVLL